MHRSGPITSLLLGAALSVAAAQSSTAQPRPPVPRISQEVRQQLESLRAEKAARSPAQRKISSRLLYARRMRRGLAIAPGVSRLRSGVEVDADGTTVVDIRAHPSPELLDRIRELGGEVSSHFERFRAIRARFPVEEIETLAGMPEVEWIRPAGRAITRAIDVSEGDVAHRADLTRNFFSVDGSGVAVGVLSDGVDSLSALQASGDLPPTVTVLPGQAGSGSEGTAMLEIIHDLAPGADLLFATAFRSQASFASNILGLRNAGADVIVDDVGYFAEAVFQDDDVADSVDSVVAGGALYFSSAGNGGNLNDGTSGVWEGDFSFTGITFNGGPAHDFGGGVIANQITLDSPFVFTLQWSDAQGASGNDYDLFLVDADITEVLDASTNIQNGNDDPFEIINSGPWNDLGNRLIIVRSSGNDRFLHLNANRGRLEFATQGQTSGHSAAAGALSVAAVYVVDAGGVGGVFDGSESVETYSSDGPRRIFYQATGTPITPGDFSSAGGALRQKPDITAADCVSTATPGFGVFCGTSAAAPHAAAIAALLIELGSGTGLTPAQIRDALASTALDIEAAGVDRDSGSGIVDAFEAADAVDLSGCEDGMDNDGDGVIDFPDDPGCDSASDPSEQSAALHCDDGLDNDGDGFIDFPEDPGCRSLDQVPGLAENPQCQDGVDNDGREGIDFDGGASRNGGTPIDVPDPQCIDRPWKNRETKRAGICALGPEIPLLLFPLLWIRRRRRRRSALAPIAKG
jgi:hypothetical protein